MAGQTLTRIMIPHGILQKETKNEEEKRLSFHKKSINLLNLVRLKTPLCLMSPIAVINTDTRLCFFYMACHSDCTRTSHFLTLSGLSDAASTKEWENFTIPTLLFSQNLWHQELGEAIRQSSYSTWGEPHTRGRLKKDREEKEEIKKKNIFLKKEDGEEQQ